jgi:hypothetical protein
LPLHKDSKKTRNSYFFPDKNKQQSTHEIGVETKRKKNGNFSKFELQQTTKKFNQENREILKFFEK